MIVDNTVQKVSSGQKHGARNPNLGGSPFHQQYTAPKETIKVVGNAPPPWIHTRL